MEVIIDGIVYVPKKKSELDLLKEKYESRDYICIRGETHYQTTKYLKVNDLSQFSFGNFKLIHKKHKDILDAYLADNSVEIEVYFNTRYILCDGWIDGYSENCAYRLKQQYPIFKRNEDGEMFKYHSNGNITCLLSTHNIGQVFTEYNSKVCKFNISGVETIPYDKERGLYHLQPVWCWNDEINGIKDIQRTIRFYLYDGYVTANVSISKVIFDNIEPITPKQLKVMPFIFDMYKEILKEN